MSDHTNSDIIIEISPSAVAKISDLIESRGRGDLAVRVILRGRLPGGGYQSEFKFVNPDEYTDTDIVQDTGSFKMFFDGGCANSISGAKVDFDENKYSSGFKIEYPEEDIPSRAAPKEWHTPAAIAVQKVIDEEINPGVAAHAGWVDLLDVKEDTAYVEMGGGCQGCGLSEVTLQQGIERSIIDSVPEIKVVIDTTNHADGNNPYYSPAKGGDWADDGESPLSK